MSDNQPTQMSKDFYVGKTLQGNYFIERLVGKGGMAWVYKTMHVKFREPMAIKILLPHICEEPDVRARFLEEARIQFRLKHPHIVQVTDIIEDGSLIAIVMEWVEGENLKQLLRKLNGPISRKDIWRIMGPILDAVGYAHKQNLVHRDIKPANILLHTEGERLVPKIADFGIAKIIDESMEGRTATGITMGTLKFMPPEQIRDSKRVDHRADIYALGATLYVMATRRLPFLGKGDWVIYQQLNEDPPPPSSFNPQLSDAFDRVVLKCMAKEPEHRYSSCAELAQALSLALLDPSNIKQLSKQELNSMDIYNLLVSLPEESSLYSSSMEIMSPAAISPMPTGSIAAHMSELLPDLSGSFAAEESLDQTGDSGTGQTNQATAATNPGQANPPATIVQSNQSFPPEEPPPDVSPSQVLPAGNANSLVLKTVGLTVAIMLVTLVIGAFVFKEMFGQQPPTTDAGTTKAQTSPPQLRPGIRPIDPPCMDGATRPCYTGTPSTKGKGICKAGKQTCQKRKWSSCQGQVLPFDEVCNGKDDDCDGQTDETFADKGKTCKAKLGMCDAPGKYICSSDQTKLTCIPTGRPINGAQVNIWPKRVRFKLRFGRRSTYVRGKTCIQSKRGYRLTITHRRYYRCQFYVRASQKQIRVKMSRLDPNQLDPPLGACKR
jgi:serine/threonine-protein kinase